MCKSNKQTTKNEREKKQMTKELFKNRVKDLRKEKGISAREMSLSLGQSENYITHIENGKIMPSMNGFFLVCDFFEITPEEFFTTEKAYPVKFSELEKVCKTLTAEQIDLLIGIAENMKK